MKYDFNNFGKLLFDFDKLKKYLPTKTFENYLNAYYNQKELTIHDLDIIAKSLKKWALENNCTHYAHYFYSLKGISGEKQNSLFLKDEENQIIEFNYNSLIKEEIDASSFPHGGLRNTYSALGYAYYDINSFCFIRNNVLYIPSLLISNNNYSLDNKRALLKSKELINKIGVKLFNLLGYKDVNRLVPYLGLEQEFFLIDKDDFLKRKDLFLTGKSLFGNPPNKNQECDTHYLSKLPLRVKRFFSDANKELFDLGIKIKTQHSEVAPCQFEIAPLYEEVNIAIDKNMIIVNILQEIALKYNLVCLIKEVPFKSINGSGKHNNYSLITNTRINVFDKGENNENELIFLIFNTALIEAINKYNDLYKVMISSPSNESRLGGNEAPNNVITIYLSEYYHLFLNQKIQSGAVNKSYSINNTYLETKENDRNRTSAISFSKNKYEFRSLGSSMDASELNTIINLSLYEILNIYIKEFKKLKNKHSLNKETIREFLKIRYEQNKRVVYNDNCYARDFITEITKRKLNNLTSFPKIIELLEKKQNKQIYLKNKIFKEKEINARINVKYENYYLDNSLDLKVILYISKNYFIPYLEVYLKDLSTIFKEIKNEYLNNKINTIMNLYNNLNSFNVKLNNELNELNSITSLKDKCQFIENKINITRNKLISFINECEYILPEKYITYPNYDEILYKFNFN